jgi:hypothetical protein
VPHARRAALDISLLYTKESVPEVFVGRESTPLLRPGIGPSRPHRLLRIHVRRARGRTWVRRARVRAGSCGPTGSRAPLRGEFPRLCRLARCAALVFGACREQAHAGGKGNRV